VQALVVAAFAGMNPLLVGDGCSDENEVFSACFTMAARAIRVSLDGGANREKVTGAVQHLLMMCADDTKGKIQ